MRELFCPCSNHCLWYVTMAFSFTITILAVKPAVSNFAVYLNDILAQVNIGNQDIF